MPVIFLLIIYLETKQLEVVRPQKVIGRNTDDLCCTKFTSIFVKQDIFCIIILFQND